MESTFFCALLYYRVGVPTNVCTALYRRGWSFCAVRSSASTAASAVYTGDEKLDCQR